MMIRLSKITVVLLSFLALPGLGKGQDVLTNGQIDFLQIGFNNSNINNPFWTIQIKNESTDTTYDPLFSSSIGRWVFDTAGGARFRVAGPQHLFVRPFPASWSFTGAGPGDLFRATPQNGDPTNQLVLGVATVNVPNGIFVNNTVTITMSVAGITNPGHYSYYSNDDPPNSALGNLGTVLLSTHDNITSFTRFAGTQNNFNMAFSQPGLYDVDFQFSGTRVANQGGGLMTSDFYRYTFDIAPFAVPEPTTWALIGFCVLSGLGGYWWHRRRRLAMREMVVHR